MAFSVHNVTSAQAFDAAAASTSGTVSLTSLFCFRALSTPNP